MRYLQSNSDGSTGNTTNIGEVLEKFRGRLCYFENKGGNNGDELIRLGSFAALEQHGIIQTSELDEADVIVFRGGGSFNDFSGEGIKSLVSHLGRRPECPIIVLPQSYKFDELDFPALFRSHRSPVYLFARERYSYYMLSKMTFPSMVHIYLDHDMALHLADQSFITNLRDQVRNQHILIVERGDIESPTGKRCKAFPVPWAKKLFSQHARTRIKRLIRRGDYVRNARSEFAQKSLKEISEHWPDVTGLPILAADISDQGTASFETFYEMIANAAAVATNRLHVGILAAMLGRRTLMSEGSYHKITGIYEYSLCDLPHVELMT